MSIMLYAIPVFFFLIGVELLIGRLRRTQLYTFSDAVSNINCGVQQQVTGVVFKTVLFAGYLWLYEHRLFNIPDTWWSYVLVFIGVDFFYYWFHRSTHEISFLWGTHIVHHQSEEYNLSVALRQSAIQAFASNIFYWPLALIGFNPVAFLLMSAFQTLYQFWIHTRMIKKLHPAFEYLFNTPSHHRVHHGQNPKYLDKNHGGTLIIFDRWFGTFQEEEEEPVYGVTVPLRTWNPAWAQIDYYVWLFNKMFQARTWADRWRMLVRKPGWLPSDLGGAVKGAAAPENFVKFSTPTTPTVNRYVWFNFLVLLAMTVWFLSTAKPEAVFSLKSLSVYAWIIWTTAGLGALLDGRRWAVPAEVVRWVIGIALVGVSVG